MKIINKWIETQSGLEAIAEYEDSDNFSELPYEECSQVACFAFNKKGELLVVYKEKTNTWGVVAGSINKPETFEECAIRELKEESNTRPIKIEPIGFQKAYLANKPDEYNYQLRVFCKIETIGEFLEDPDGDITAIKYTDPKDYKKYFDWGKVGDRIMERALEKYS